MLTRINGKITESDAAAGLKLLQTGLGRHTPVGVELHPLEAAFLMERKIAEVTENGKPISVADLLTEKKKEKKIIAGPKSKSKSSHASTSPALPSLSDQFLIYNAFRGTGHVVRFSPSSPAHWRVLARGVGREQERATVLVQLTTPDWSATLERLEQALALSRLLRLELTLAFVKEGRPHLLKITKPPL